MADTSTASTHTNVYWIDPLTGAKNYATWKIKMMDILTGQDLWEYVDRSITEQSEAAAKATWKKKDRMVLLII